MMWKFHSKLLTVGNYHNPVSWTKGGSCWFLSMYSEKMKVLFVSAGGWMCCRWQIARLPNRLFLMHLVSGDNEMFEFAETPSSYSIFLSAVSHLRKELICYQINATLSYWGGMVSFSHHLCINCFTLDIIFLFLQIALFTVGWRKSKKRHVSW